MSDLQVNRSGEAVGRPLIRGCRGIILSAVRFTMPAVVVMLIATGSLLAQQTSEVLLGGYNEVPRVNTSGSGVLEVTLNADTLTVSGTFSDLRGAYTSSGIYYGRPNENGNRILQLDADVDETRRSGTFPPEDNTFLLTPSLKEGLQLGRLYINITTNTRRHGEIRGQIPIMIAD